MEYYIRDFLNMFNDGELDVEKYFNNYDTFFNILRRKGLFGNLDPINGPNNEDWQNEYLLSLYNSNDKVRFNFWVEKMLGDVDFDEKGNTYLVLQDRGDLAGLFCRNYREDISQDTVRSILQGEDVFEPYWDTTDDVYRDVIEELDKENLEHLKEIIVKNLQGQQISTETEEMELIAAEQGHNDYWEITNENVSRILDDEDSMKSLLDDELRDLKSELYSIHSNSYNSAYEEEIYSKIWKELQDYFDGEGTFFTAPHPYKKDTQVEKFKIEISDFYGVLTDYLVENKGYGNSGTLEYQGSFLNILKESKDCLGVWAPDYPDSRKIDRNINMYFKHYL